MGLAAGVLFSSIFMFIFARPNVTNNSKLTKTKSSNEQMTNQISAVWEKRQMGNVLLIIILGIKIVLAETRPE